MPQSPHLEKHFTSSESVRDIVIGMADGLTVPFALAVAAVRADRGRWVDFMMRFELGLEKPDPRRARNSAFTIAVSYVVGGMVPLLPYFLTDSVHTGLGWSVAVTLFALMAFGYVKGSSRRLGRSAVHGRRRSWAG